MSFLHYVKQALKIIILDKKAIKQVAQDKNATVPAIILSVLGLLVYSIVPFVGQASFLAIFLNFLLSVLVTAIFMGLTHALARGFGSKDKFMQFFRPIMLFSLFDLVYLLVLIPQLSIFLNIIFLIWGLVVTFVVIKETYHLKTGRAIGVLLLSLLIGIIITTILMAFFGGLLIVAKNLGLYLPN